MLARLVGKTFMLVALLDRGLQGGPAGEGFWRGLGLGL